MDLVESLARHREELAHQLKHLRLDADISGAELSRRLGWSQSRVSRIETGRQTPTVDEVRAIARELGAPRALIDELLANLNGVEREWSDVRMLQAFGSQQRQMEVQDIEAKAKEILVFQPTLIPGLLQTPDYTRSIADTSGTYTDAADVESDVQIRKERQALLTAKDKRFRFVITEAALWNRFASGAVMSGQYQRLLDVLKSKVVGLGVIPRHAKLPLLPMTGFNIFDSDLVGIETITSELALRHPTDVADYRKMFGQLETCAVSGKQAIRIIEEIEDAIV